MQKTELTYGERAVKEFREKVANEAIRLFKIEMQEQYEQQLEQEKRKIEKQMEEQLEQFEQKKKQMEEQLEQIKQERRNLRKSIARNLLSYLNDNTISEVTGLSIEEVVLLREEKN